MEFAKAKLRIETDVAENTTRLSIKPDGSDDWQVCMQLNFHVQYKVHMFISGSTHVQKPAAIYIDKLQYSDTDPPSSKEVEWLKQMKAEGALEDFNLQGLDLMHKGNADGELALDEANLLRIYNDELVRYNNQYSRLVGNFHTNSDLITKIIQGLPEQRFLMEL